MKPTIRSTSIALLGVGVLAFLLLPFGTVLTVPSVLAGVGLFLRLRYAWWLALAVAVAELGIAAVLIALKVFLGGGGWSIASLALPLLLAVVGLYILVSLFVVRRELAPRRR